MKKGAYSLVLVVAIGGVVVAGVWRTTGSAPGSVQATPTAHVHGAPAPLAGRSGLSPATIAIGADTQQVIGVRVSPVEKAPLSRTLRVLGRVAADETRVYRLNAGIEGSIREVSAVTTGSRVTKDQLLATFSAPAALSVLQLFIINSGGLERVKQRAAEGSVEGQGVPLGMANVWQRTDQLRNFGVSPLQLEEIAETRAIPEGIKIFAPADGIVIARNVSPGLKFERGFEFYRIADLERVWIVADVFENEAHHLRPGVRAHVSLVSQRTTVSATVAAILPPFDPATRTLKVRLEADNRGYALRPDMFVDVDLSIGVPATIAVPTDAVVDSGLAKRVFVERSDGAFESREVETGRRFRDRVEIVKGLAAGERIVTSGTFLLDSESRMRLSVTGAAASPSAPASAPTGHERGAHGSTGHGQTVKAGGDRPHPTQGTAEQEQATDAHAGHSR